MPTYILIHGAYQGGWIWKPVATRLRAAGHLVYAPTLDGCGERGQLVRAGITVGTHGREIAQLLFYEDLSDVVLVGTSSGGMVVQKAAELARERIARLGFVDALALMPGERVDDIVKRAAPNEVTELTTGPTRAAGGADGGHHVLGPGMAGHGHPLPPRGQSPRTPPATHRGAAQGRVARAGHRPLSDAERAGGPDQTAAGLSVRRAQPWRGGFAISAPPAPATNAAAKIANARR